MADIVQANLIAATTEGLTIGTSTTLTIAAIAETIHDVTDTDADVVHVDTRKGDIDHSQDVITKARDMVGYEPQYSIEDRLRASLRE